jgi:tRNA modification GTPase
MPSTRSNTRIEDAARSGCGTAILLTAPGVAALATIRLWGPAARALLERHFSAPLRDGLPVHGTFSVRGRLIDDPLVLWDSRQQQADIHVHGGHWVIREVLDAARVAGFEVVERSGLPLPRQAVDAQTALEAEMLQWLPLAVTREAAASLLGQPKHWRALQKRAQAGEPVDLSHLAADSALSWLLHGPRVAIVGIPNAGKSTLANALFARDRSITADLPGTTRDWVGDTANLDGLPIHLIDTPGLRATACAIEAEAIARARQVIAQADLVVLLLDPTAPLDGAQASLRAAYPDALAVMGKADLAAANASPGYCDVLCLSAVSGGGLDQLRQTIRARFGCADLPLDKPCVWTDRQRSLLGNASQGEAIRQVLGESLGMAAKGMLECGPG